MIVSDKVFRRIVATVDCTFCHGTGKRYTTCDYNQLELTPCDRCRGTGEIETTQDFDISRNYNKLIAEIELLKKEVTAKRYKQMFKKPKIA